MALYISLLSTHHSIIFVAWVYFIFLASGMSSAMSASSPPTGLMPLSLISEHKTAVPGVPLQRTPEKMNQQQQQPVGPTAALPPQAGQPPPQPRVSNGMEGPIPQAAPYPHQQEPSHPSSTVEASGVAIPPLTHHPNIPSKLKAIL